MKLGADNSLKFAGLKARLGWPRWQVIGLLEGLWLLTAQNAPRGDIGRHSNAAIAIGLEIDADKIDDIIDALVAERWLDRSEKYRLVVHGWGEHAPDMIRKRLARRGETTVDAEEADGEQPSNAADSQRSADSGGQRRTTADNGRPSIQSNPIQSNPIPSTPSESITRADLTELTGLSGADALDRLRITDPARERLLACGTLTGEAVADEWTHCIGPLVHNPEACLVRRLEKRLKLEPSTTKGMASHLTTQLAQARRNARSNGRARR